jgi:putative phage-type endonuclease
MRVVTANSAVWRRCGVGSAEVAAVLNVHADAEMSSLVLWALLVHRRERPEVQRMRKERLAQGSAEWLDWRKKGVGGSEVACVMGANPYADSKADRIWARKLPPDDPNALPEVKDNPAMAHGRKNEPDARKHYEALMGWSAKDICVVHDDLDYLRVSLDGLSEDGRIVLEVKCPGERNHQKYLNISRIDDPLERQQAYSEQFDYYRYQVLYQLAITEAKLAHFVSYRPDWSVPDERFVLMTLYPEPDEQRRLIERVGEFWGYVERREPPPTEFLVPCGRRPSELAIP